MDAKIVNGYPFVRYERDTYTPEQMIKRSKEYLEWVDQRRTVRDFSDQPIPKEVIENIILSASAAPSGAHKQPWTFCVVSDPSLKSAIRIEAEKEEYESYHGRMSEEWIDDLRRLQTDWQKPFLETAPCLIVVFKKVYDINPFGLKRNNYYVNESVGIACGFLLTAIHHAGLVALTHTPNPMNFLTKILKRPENERPYLLIPVGYPARDTFVPKLERKQLNEIAVFY
jgi:iodotyrosine deiodinase